VTSSAAPVSERLRIVQEILAPPNEIIPAFSTRCLGALRPSSTAFTPYEKMSQRRFTLI
jgi:hypothetical protein